MEFNWIANESSKPSITISSNNITLNTAACTYFDDVEYVLIGYNSNNKQIGIKPITKEQLELNIYDKSILHKISRGKSYGRISNKLYITEILNDIDEDLSKGSTLKFVGNYDVMNKIFLVDVMKGEKK